MSSREYTDSTVVFKDDGVESTFVYSYVNDRYYCDELGYFESLGPMFIAMNTKHRELTILARAEKRIVSSSSEEKIGWDGFAVVDSNGLNLVIYGVGDTKEAAVADSERWFEGPPTEYRKIVPVSQEEMNNILLEGGGAGYPAIVGRDEGFPHACLVVVPKDDLDLVLAIERKNVKGQWGLPGGKRESGESFQQCAARELKEETGLHVEPSELFQIYRAVVDGYDTMTFVPTSYNGLVEERKEGRVEWIEWSRLLKGAYPEYNRAVMHSLTRNGWKRGIPRA